MPTYDAPSLLTGQVPVTDGRPATGPIRRPAPRQRAPSPRTLLVVVAVAVAVVAVLVGVLLATRPTDGEAPGGGPAFTYRPADPPR